MSETAARHRWAWRCTAAACSDDASATFRTEDEARAPADHHSRATGHRVAWGILHGRFLR